MSVAVSPCLCACLSPCLCVFVGGQVCFACEGACVCADAVGWRGQADKQKKLAASPQHWTTERYETRRIDCDAPKMRPKPPPPAPKLLVFYAWWFEEGVKKYMELRYDMTAKVFHIILNKSVALRDVKIAGRDGELLQCWDLFVGQKMDVLGKPTTLMQASHATLLWLEHHARRLLKKVRAWLARSPAPGTIGCKEDAKGVSWLLFAGDERLPRAAGPGARKRNHAVQAHTRHCAPDAQHQGTVIAMRKILASTNLLGCIHPCARR